MKAIILIACLLLFSTANAGKLVGVIPLSIKVDKNVFFSLPKESLTKDLCSFHGSHFTFDATTKSGQNMLYVLINAKTTNKKIDIWYTIKKSMAGKDETNDCSHSTLAVLRSIGLND